MPEIWYPTHWIRGQFYSWSKTSSTKHVVKHIAPLSNINARGKRVRLDLWCWNGYQRNNLTNLVAFQLLWLESAQFCQKTMALCEWPTSVSHDFAFYWSRPVYWETSPRGHHWLISLWPIVENIWIHLRRDSSAVLWFQCDHENGEVSSTLQLRFICVPSSLTAVVIFLCLSIGCS